MSKSATAAASAVPKPLAHNPTPSSVDQLRSLPFVGGHELPALPSGYLPVPRDDKSVLLKLEEGRRAELREALVEVHTKRDILTHNLGRFAPDSDLALQLRDQLDTTHAANLQAQRIADFCADKEDVVNHDALAYINRIATKISVAADEDPSVGLSFPALMTFVTQRSEAISHGIAKAKALKAEEAEKASKAGGGK